LPVQRKSSKIDWQMDRYLEFATSQRSAEYIERVRLECKTFPTRVFANCMVNFSWRNGPIENIHAGKFRGYPLDLRRITPQEERELTSFASGRFNVAMYRAYRSRDRSATPSWEATVFSYGLIPFVAPHGWSLGESSRSIKISGENKCKAIGSA